MMGLETMAAGNVGEKDAPPVNNACMPDIYNKLDADTIEKTRVINALLDVKLNIQEKVLTKYRSAVERSYTKERDRVRSDLRRISRRLPNYADIPNLETKIMKIKRRRKSDPKHNCLYTTEPREIKGVPAERDDRPFCDRFFSHHLPTKASWYKDLIPAINKGLSMPELGLRARNAKSVRHIPLSGTVPNGHVGTLGPGITGHGVSGHDVLGQGVIGRDVHGSGISGHGGLVPDVPEPRNSRIVFPKIHALDDNFLSCRSVLRDDDDSKTV